MANSLTRYVDCSRLDERIEQNDEMCNSQHSGNCKSINEETLVSRRGTLDLLFFSFLGNKI